MVERSLRMREARGSIPRVSNFFYVLPLQFAHKVIILVPLFFFLYTGGKLSMATQHEFRITSFLSL
jgi:hypothetical protein